MIWYLSWELSISNSMKCFYRNKIFGHITQAYINNLFSGCYIWTLSLDKHGIYHLSHVSIVSIECTLEVQAVQRENGVDDV